MMYANKRKYVILINVLNKFVITEHAQTIIDWHLTLPPVNTIDIFLK